MKTNLIVAGMLILAGTLKAQWNSGNPELTNTAVGIGMTSGFPASKLEVVTPGGVDGIKITAGNNTSFNAALLTLDAASNGVGGHKYSIGSIGANAPSGQATNLNIFDHTSSASVFAITGSGNIGMGVTAPVTKLEVLTTTGADDGVTVKQNGGGAAGLFLNATNNYAFLSYNNGNFALRETGASTEYLFMDASNTYIGMGTITPANKLEVQANAGGSDGIRVTQAGGGAASLFLNQTASENWSMNALNGSAGFSIRNETNNLDAVNVLPTGEVGIGTSSPTEQLHTTAGVRFEGVTTGGSGLVGLSIDATGKLWKGNGGGISNSCSTVDNIPKTTSGGNLQCSQIDDDGTTVSIGSPASCSFNWSSGVSSAPGWLVNTSNFPPNGTGTAKLCVNGVTRSLAYYAYSDERFKKNIRSITSALSVIDKLDPKTYSWRKDEFKDRGFNDAPQIGFIAQDLEKVIPEVVVTGSDGYKSVNYDMIIPILAQGIKELKLQVENLQSQLSAADKKTSASTSVNQLNVAIDGFVLDQNIPNPFSNETVIKYRLTKEIKNASLMVYDLSGKQVTSFPLDLNASAITITSEKLSAGIYIYSVMADGKIMDSKRMVVSGKE